MRNNFQSKQTNDHLINCINFICQHSLSLSLYDSHTHTHTRTHTRMHAHTHTHTHTHKCLFLYLWGVDWITILQHTCTCVILVILIFVGFIQHMLNSFFHYLVVFINFWFVLFSWCPLLSWHNGTENVHRFCCVISNFKKGRI